MRLHQVNFKENSYEVNGTELKTTALVCKALSDKEQVVAINRETKESVIVNPVKEKKGKKV